MRKIFILSVLGLLWISSGQAADIPVNFDSPSDQLRYNQLLEELRCLVCQNQSLADSHAELAQDLRTEVYNMIVSGQANADIVKFMVERYGDFVLYKPPMKSTTWLLWFGPALLVIAALTIVVVAARKSKAQ
ncbi:MAG: cytochrome c-type biogenesis protein CcmH, partial [Gammaproteobacteria bacterium]